MILFAHRGNTAGAFPAQENTLAQIQTALEHGFGVETDIRRARDGGLYIRHDSVDAPQSPLADQHARLWRRFPSCPIALNIKELGYESQLVSFVETHELADQVFLFDFELLENTPGQTATLCRKLHPTLKLAARVSDRYGESVEQALSISCADMIWLDEFDALWIQPEHVAQLKAANKALYAISPEIHGFSMLESETRWKQFREWGVDGICTDWPIRAREVLTRC